MKKKMMSLAAICLAMLNLTGCSSDFGDKMSKAGMNTLMGMGVVFCVLIFISFIIWLFGFIPKLISGERKSKVSKKDEKQVSGIERAVETITANEEAELTDDLELVAVITAAIMAAMGDEAPEDGLVVRSIKKRNTKNWKNA